MIRTPMILALSGKAGSGKDTIADFLCADHGFVRYSFAGPIKRGLSAMFESVGLNERVWEDREAKEAPLPLINKSPRYLAQTLGTEWGRTLVMQDVWLQLARAFVYNEFEAGNKRIVFTDARFDNEAKLTFQLGEELKCACDVICVERPGIEPVNAHESERGLSEAFTPYCGLLINSGTREALRGMVAEYVASIEAGHAEFTETTFA